MNANSNNTNNSNSQPQSGIAANTQNQNALMLQQIIKKLSDMFGGRDYKKVYELATKIFKENTTNMEILRYKMKSEEELGKIEDALRTANMMLMIQPFNMECHQTKIRLLKKLQKFNELSDSLVATKILFPQLTLNQD
ncbi:hypothetical protein TTHERM_00939160 (macronuclear) [Tetrahymena thermophila SB210]|uniref:Tetratricopeptide repeat protein n=1 Tax=Tetrahymena thermophila (strain SB210) TaxID=312017 RepID=Q22DM7_TETTS|nr:hypothetical protein TTHERM_00939160 [Tetrahymena thermophila SB210]EAR83427.1 hypothetical protein TTHERM_00939160 [Tetrahymena thermophila SB210]|eukprot:XP_001031090.1 hypothetical protein TTHERM_00939160 [Tetrahymena thermophila SB210]